MEPLHHLSLPQPSYSNKGSDDVVGDSMFHIPAPVSTNIDTGGTYEHGQTSGAQNVDPHVAHNGEVTISCCL